MITNRIIEKNSGDFPLGLPTFETSNYFKLEDAIDWLAEFAKSESNPYLTYFHLLPPHSPYHTRAEFYNRFENDGYVHPKKPRHFMAEESYNQNQIFRKMYDEYMLYVDSEIERLFSTLESAGSLENTWIILTSDHGEIFERGLKKHRKPSFYDPIAKVPLIIFPPGQKERIDIHTPTSAVSLLPTLKAIVGQEPPSWPEGVVLPPFSESYPEDTPIFNVGSYHEDYSQPYKFGSLMLRKGQYKLIYHFGNQDLYAAFEGSELYELYDLERDPEEMNNLYETETKIAALMRKELIFKMRDMGVR
jgi:arylsulfatase A-like enzyme